jgi:hypothetical protein
MTTYAQAFAAVSELSQSLRGNSIFNDFCTYYYSQLTPEQQQQLPENWKLSLTNQILDIARPNPEIFQSFRVYADNSGNPEYPAFFDAALVLVNHAPPNRYLDINSPLDAPQWVVDLDVIRDRFSPADLNVPSAVWNEFLAAIEDVTPETRPRRGADNNSRGDGSNDDHGGNEGVHDGP